MNATRRAVLAGAGAAALGGLAGCSGAAGDPEDGAASGAGDGARLAYVRLVNNHAAAHTVHVLVQRGGEPVHWSSHRLAGGGGDAAETTVASSWTNEPGEFSVFVRLDSADDWSEFDVGDGTVECYGFEARVRADGRVEALFAKNPDGCASGTAGTGTTTADGSG